MAGIKGAKPKVVLTTEQKQRVYEMLIEDGSQILDVSRLEELQMSSSAYTRRANVDGFPVKVGRVMPSLETIKVISTKAWVELQCSECSDRFVAQPRRLLGRKYGDYDVCQSCIMKVTCNSKEWRKSNSEAQLIVQNTEQAKSRNRASQKRRFRDPELRERYREIGRELWARPEYRRQQTLRARENWKNPEYAKRVAYQGRSKYQGTYKGMLYQSLTELSFILWKEDVVERYDLGPIPYEMEDGWHSYYPDFKIGNTIIEIKGSLKGYFGKPKAAELIRIKQKAAEQFCKAKGLSYRITVAKEIPKIYHTLARRLHGQDYSQNT